MATYLYTITPCSPLGTPFQSDTLYGHLLCAAGEMDGGKVVEELIDRFKGSAPPFTLSSAFPSGMLPIPVLPGIPCADFQRFSQERKEFGGKMYKALEKYKEFRKIKWLPVSLWEQFSTGLSQQRLFGCYLDHVDSGVFSTWAGSVELEAHNTIDRCKGTVLSEGGLYLSESTFYPPGATLDLYVRTDDLATFERYFDVLAKTGYGRDRSAGKGSFSYQRHDQVGSYLVSGAGNAHLSLSVCSHQNLAGVRGFYKTFTKYGKVWNGFGQNNPFKKPFLAFAEGSVFTKLPESGYVLQNIHSDPMIVQITLPLTIPFLLEES